MKPVVVDRTQPNTYITALTKYKQSGTLLDMGAAQGRHAIYFAQHNFDVTAVDPDATLLTELKQRAEAAHVQVKLVQADIEGFQPVGTYDVVVCAMVLHFLEHDELNRAAHKLQALTAPQGLNVISAYTNQNKGDFMKDNPFGHEKYLLRPNELRELYSGWELLEYSEDWTPPGIINPGDMPTSYHKVNMIARKL